MKVLMVCLGNICRSPAAEGIFSNRFPDIEFDSAGTGSWHVGHPPDHRSIEVCGNHGVDIASLRARQVTAVDGEHFDLILGMDQSNVRNLKAIIPQEFHDKIHPIDAHEVGDPYYGIMDGFEVMFQHLEQAADKWAIIWESAN